MRLAIVALMAAAGAMTACSGNKSTSAKQTSSSTSSWDQNYAYQDADRYYHPGGKFYDSTTRRYYDKTSVSYQTASSATDSKGRRYETWYNGDRTSLDRDRETYQAIPYDNTAQYQQTYYQSQQTNYQSQQANSQNQQQGQKMDQAYGDGSAVLAPADFVKKTAEKSKVDVELSRIAARQAESSKVRQFAKRMVDDQTKMNDELTRLAGSENIELPIDSLTKNRDQIDQLSSLSGQAFDRKYMETMLNDHARGVRVFERHAKYGQDAEIRAFAENQLPTLREHYRLARDIGREMGIQVDDSQLSGVEADR